MVVTSRTRKPLYPRQHRNLPAARKRRLVKQRSASDTLIDIGLALLATGLTTVNVGIKVAVDAYQDVKAMLNPSNHLPGWLSGSEWNTGGKVLEIGDKVAVGTVTSIFGPRISPGGVGSTYHQGIDIGHPTGTILYNPGGNWDCISSTRSTTGASLLPRRQKEQAMWDQG